MKFSVFRIFSTIVFLAFASTALADPGQDGAPNFGGNGQGPSSGGPGGAGGNRPLGGGSGGPGGGGVGGPMRQACRGDVESFCQNIQPGGGRIIACLEDHYKQISDACYQSLQNRPQHGHGPNGGNQGPASPQGAPGAPPSDDNPSGEPAQN